jgi:hypothetical protein
MDAIQRKCLACGESFKGGKSASEVLLPEVPSERPKRLRWINIGKSGVTAEGLAAVTAPARDPLYSWGDRASS